MTHNKGWNSIPHWIIKTKRSMWIKWSSYFGNSSSVSSLWLHEGNIPNKVLELFFGGGECHYPEIRSLVWSVRSHLGIPRKTCTVNGKCKHTELLTGCTNYRSPSTLSKRSTQKHFPFPVCVNLNALLLSGCSKYISRFYMIKQNEQCRCINE